MQYRVDFLDARQRFSDISVLLLGVLLCTATLLRAEGPDKANLDPQIRAAVHAHFSDVLNLPASEIVVEFPKAIHFRVTNPVWDDIVVLPGKQRTRTGLQVLKVGLFHAGELLHSTAAKVRVRTFQDVVVAQKMLRRHEIVAAQQVVLERRETTKMKRDLFASIEDVIGLRTTRVLQSGEVVTAGMVKTAPLITRGASVDIRFLRGAVEIVLPGVARQDGFYGRTIRVKCLETRKIFEAEILNAKTVLVNL